MLNQDFYKETVNVKKKCHSTTIHLQNMINTIKTHFISVYPLSQPKILSTLADFIL